MESKENVSMHYNYITISEAVSAYEPTTRISDHRIPWNFYCDMISLFNGKNRIYLALSAISPKFSDDMQGRSRTKKIVYFRVNFKLFAEGSKTWPIGSNDTKRKYCIILHFFYWLMVKYLKSDPITEKYVVSKIPHRQLISNLS